MGNTPIYGFGYIEPNQDLSENIDLDELRFKAIESTTYIKFSKMELLKTIHLSHLGVYKLTQMNLD